MGRSRCSSTTRKSIRADLPALDRPGLGPGQGQGWGRPGRPPRRRGADAIGRRAQVRHQGGIHAERTRRRSRIELDSAGVGDARGSGEGGEGLRRGAGLRRPEWVAGRRRSRPQRDRSAGAAGKPGEGHDRHRQAGGRGSDQRQRRGHQFRRGRRDGGAFGLVRRRGSRHGDRGHPGWRQQPGGPSSGDVLQEPGSGARRSPTTR